MKGMTTYPEKAGKLLDREAELKLEIAKTLSATTRKPFDLLVKGLVPKESRGDSRLLMSSEIPGVRLALRILPEIVEFSKEEIRALRGPDRAGRVKLND